MGLKSKIFVGLMALSLAGAVGGVFALTRNAATQSGNEAAYDKAVYLFWDSGQTTKEIADVSDLAANVAQYRYLTVAPKTTKGVTGKVRLSFTLESGGANTHMNGLTVAVYKTASLGTDENVETLIANVTAEPTLDKDHLTGTTEFAVSARTDENATQFESTAYYAIKVLWTGADDGDETTNYEMGASLTIAQSFVA